MLHRLTFLFLVAVVGCTNYYINGMHFVPWNGDVPMLKKAMRAHGVRPGTLVNETNRVMRGIISRYKRLALFYEDNSDENKYISSVIDFFILRFVREYYAGTSKYDYDQAFDGVLKDMNHFSEFTAMEFASPVRRHMDVVKSVISTPITLVQKHCKIDDGIECDNKYFGAAFVESTRCRQVFQHDAIFTKVRDFVVNYEEEHAQILKAIYDEVTSRRYESKSIFDNILEAIRNGKEKLKDQLIFKADLHGLVSNFQGEGKLKCFDVDRDPL